MPSFMDSSSDHHDSPCKWQSIIYRAVHDYPSTLKRYKTGVPNELLRDKGRRFALFTMASAQFRNSSLGPQLLERQNLNEIGDLVFFLLNSATSSNSKETKQEDPTYCTLGFTKSLTLSGRPGDYSESHMFLEAFTNLKYFPKSIKKITIESLTSDGSSNNKHKKEEEPHLLLLLARVGESLRELVIDHFDDNCISALSSPELFPKLTALESLSLLEYSGSHNSSQIPENIHHFSSSPSLKHFTLVYGIFTDFRVNQELKQQFRANLRSFFTKCSKTLESLKLRSLAPDLNDADILEGFFSQNDEEDNENNNKLIPSSLKKLDLRACGLLHGASIIPLLQAFVQNPETSNNLVHLNLSSMPEITDADLVAATRSMTSLQYLNVSSTRKINGSFLHENRVTLGQNLRSLLMNSTNFSDETVQEAFSEGHYSALTFLDLGNSSQLNVGKCLLGLANNGSRLKISFTNAAAVDDEVSGALKKGGVLIEIDKFDW